MKHRELFCVLAAAAMTLGVQQKARAEAFIVDASDAMNVSAESIPAAVTLTYPAGWSMISLPVTPTTNTLAALFPDAISAFNFSAGYHQVTTLGTCQGYWLNLPTTHQAQYVISGQTVDQCSQTVPVNWSMQGVPVDGTAFNNVTVTSPGVLTSVFGFASGYQQKTGTALLTMGQGFWFNMATAGTVTMNSAPGGITPKPAIYAPLSPALTDASKLVASIDGVDEALFLGADQSAILELPPLPPAGSLDLRAEVSGKATNGVPVVDQTTEFPVHLQGTRTLSWDIQQSDRGMWQLVVDGNVHALNGQGSLTLDSAQGDMSLRYTPLPKQFALHANYPNPFNPSTTIAYDLPSDVHVSLVIYDMLGQRVRELVDQVQPAGTYSVVWNGMDQQNRQAASGVYFYAIQAGQFHTLRRMLLAK